MDYVLDHPLFERRWQGVGPVLSETEFDIKTYVTINAVMHDSSIAAWFESLFTTFQLTNFDLFSKKKGA